MSESKIQNPKSKIALIVAMSRNRVIGRSNQLPWRMPADMARFKKLTMDHAVVMGRRTFESLGSKPLTGRTNIVITRDKAFRANGAIIAHGLDEALELAFEHDLQRHHKHEVFVLGGTEVFRLALSLADRIVLTLIDADIEGDASFPKVNEREWTMISDEAHAADARNPYPWRFQELVRSLPAR